MLKSYIDTGMGGQSVWEIFLSVDSILSVVFLAKGVDSLLRVG